jgi:hypothetical protein
MRNCTWLIAGLVAIPWTGYAQTPAISGSMQAVNAGPGDQSDPHVSGSLVAYTSVEDGRSLIRHHQLVTGSDAAIPNDGTTDLLSDVGGSTVVFTRVGDFSSAIYSFDTANPGAPVEIAPDFFANRRSAAIGGGTIAWEDFGLAGGGLAPEIAVVTDPVGPLVRLTANTGVDRDPAVSPDGQVIVWTHCELDHTQCDIHEARRVGGVWSSSARSAPGDEANPDTNGEVIVYSSAREEGGVLERDLFWQPVGGGEEVRLVLPGDDGNPSISGRFIAFEQRDDAGGSDIAVFDLVSQHLFRLTRTPQREALNDISVSADGLVRVVWSVPGAEGLDVMAFSFRLDDATGGGGDGGTEGGGEIPRDGGEVPRCDPAAQAITSCEDPGDRPLLATLELERTHGKPDGAQVAFESTSAEGLLCLDNGGGGRGVTSAWIRLNGDEVFRPRDFKCSTSNISRSVSLGASNVLEGEIRGKPGRSLRVRVYGAAPACTRAAAQGPGRERLASRASRARIFGERATVHAVDRASTPDVLLAEQMPLLGCSSSGSGTGLGMVLAGLAIWALASRRPKPVRVPVRRRDD